MAKHQTARGAEGRREELPGRKGPIGWPGPEPDDEGGIGWPGGLPGSPGSEAEAEVPADPGTGRAA